MHTWQIAIASAAGFLIAATDAPAQNLTIQQPVVSGFSVGTTVSVPDRGGALLGGISRAGSARSDFGPLHFGRSVGVFREHSHATAHVWIHDLDAIDRAILGQSPGLGRVLHWPSEPKFGWSGRAAAARRPNSSPLTGQAARAYRHLLNRDSAADASDRWDSFSGQEPGLQPDRYSLHAEFSQAAPEPQGLAGSRGPEHPPVASRSYRLGIAAEKRGQLGVARLHYKLAAKHGSLRAKERLAALVADPQAASASRAGSRR